MATRSGDRHLRCVASLHCGQSGRSSALLVRRFIALKKLFRRRVPSGVRRSILLRLAAWPTDLDKICWTRVAGGRCDLCRVPHTNVHRAAKALQFQRDLNSQEAAANTATSCQQRLELCRPATATADYEQQTVRTRRIHECGVREKVSLVRVCRDRPRSSGSIAP